MIQTSSNGIGRCHRSPHSICSTKNPQQVKAEKLMMVPVSHSSRPSTTIQDSKHYYVCLAGGRSSPPDKDTTRRLDAAPLSQQSGGKRPSCFRPRRTYQSDQNFRQCPSSSPPPGDYDQSSMTDVIECLRSAEFTKEKRVSFDDRVVVFPVMSLKDSPTHVRRKLWMSSDELDVSMRQAMALEIKERRRREREIDAFQEIDGNTKSELHMLSTEANDEDEDENESSMDSLDLAMSIGIEEDSLGLDSMSEVL